MVVVVVMGFGLRVAQARVRAGVLLGRGRTPRCIGLPGNERPVGLQGHALVFLVRRGAAGLAFRSSKAKARGVVYEEATAREERSWVWRECRRQPKPLQA